MTMGTFFFFLTALVIPGFPSGALVGRWGLLALGAATLLFKTELPKSAWALLAYLAVMTWWGPVWYEAVNLYIHAIFLVVLYCYAARLEDLRRIAIGVGLGIALNSVVAVGQAYLGWQFIPQITPGSGLYFNRNIASEGAAMALALAVGYRMWWLIPGTLPTLMLGSRAPLVALGVAGAIAVYRYSKFYAALAILLPILLAVAWVQSHGDVVYAGILDTLKQRLGTWYDAAYGFTLLGRGLGSWIIDFPMFQQHTSTLELRWENAHNDTVQLLFELGIGGAILVATFLFRLATSERNPAFYALVVFAVESIFEFPLYQPVTGAIMAVCAGFLFSRSTPIRDLVVRRGLSVRDGDADTAGDLHRPGGSTVPADAGPTFGAGLSCYSATRFKRRDQDRAGVTI